MHRFRQMMEIPAQRVGERLRLIVVKETRQVSPAPVMPYLDKACADLCSKEHPPQDQNGNQRRRAACRSHECCKEACFQKHRFPTKSIKGLADIDDGKIKSPEKEPRRQRY